MNIDRQAGWCVHYWHCVFIRILGCLGRPTPPPGGRAGSENNTLLPMTMICDRLKFWSGPAWRSKVIIRKPWRRKNKKKKKKKKEKKKKKFWQTHKAFPAGSRECLINVCTDFEINRFRIDVMWRKNATSCVMGTATLLIDILTRNILKPTRSLYDFRFRSYGSNSGFRVFGDLDLDLWHMFFFFVWSHALRMMYWNIYAKFH